MKHFNKAVIIGVIHEVKERKSKHKNTPYCDIFVKCSSEKYGSIRTRFRLWDKTAMKDVIKCFKNSPGDVWRFEGFADQYESEGVLFNGATGFDAKVILEETTHRATFILNGEYTGSRFDAERGTLNIGLKVRKKKNDSSGDDESEFFVEMREEDFDSLGFSYKGLKAGADIQVRGHQADLDAEFGSSGQVALLVEKYNHLKATEKDEEGF